MGTPVKPSFFILLVTLLCFFKSCKTNTEENPVLTSIDNLNQTEFVFALEQQVNDSNNIIYTPTILFAWDEIRNSIGIPILKDSINFDFKLLNQSTSHKNSLNKDEYNTEINIEGREITAKANFVKSLFFEPKFQKSEIPLTFDNQKIKAFGMYDYEEAISKNVKLLYYKNEGLFIVALKPKEENQQIILAKGIDSIKSLQEGIQKINFLTSLNSPDELTSDDKISIPLISFNIDTYYKKLEEIKFTTEGDTQKYILTKAYQQTMFVLNESGTKIESEAIIKAKADSIAATYQPKNLIFDRPFIVIMKHTGKENPYFVARIANSELLIRY
ncbi:MAG: serpin family protein [Dysgonomonas sp.]